MMIDSIATAAVYVADQPASCDFWTRQVGFEVARRIPLGNGLDWLVVRPPSAVSGLVLYPRSLMADWAQRKPSIVFACANVRACFEELRSRGVEFAQEPRDMSWGPFAIFRDLDDNEFGLRQGN